jgi:LPXTG-motif cell wall-anchored protein
MASRRGGRVLVAGVILAVLAFASPALAQDNYGGEGTLVCSPTDVEPGTVVTCTLTGCNTGATATFTLNGTVVGTGVSQSPVTVTFTIPSGVTPGGLTVTGSCDGLATALSTTLTVLSGGGSIPASTSNAGSLPATGGNSIEWAKVALALIAVGALLVLASRKRAEARQQVAA